MKSAETEILVIPGYEGSGPDHWQSRLIRKLTSAKRVEQPDWHYGDLDLAIAQVVNAVEATTKPVVFIAHSAGCHLVAHAMLKIGANPNLRGAYLVAAPCAATLANLPKLDPRMAKISRKPLPFPSLLIASSNDPYASLDQQKEIAADWGSTLVEAGEVGHINSESGHGPWPEGIMRFAGWLSKL